MYVLIKKCSLYSALTANKGATRGGAKGAEAAPLSKVKVEKKGKNF